MIAAPVIDHGAISRFLESESLSWMQTAATSPGDEICEFAGRICYMSYGASNQRDNVTYLKNIIQQGHESVLEHATWTFLVTGVTRAFSHQLVRHRSGFSFSQLSQQYHDESEADFLPPIGLDQDSDVYRLWEQQVLADKSAYIALLRSLEQSLPASSDEKERLRLIRSAARSLLPNCVETKLAVTANARAIRHFLELRGATSGDLEMRYFSAELLTAVRPSAPVIFSDFELTHCETDGHPHVKKRE